MQVWLNTGGVQGESPMCQTPAMLEAAGIPYIGHSPLNAALLDDKGLFKLACRGLGINTAPFIIHNPASEFAAGCGAKVAFTW
jgi:D-alanine-D-alanine ligase